MNFCEVNPHIFQVKAEERRARAKARLPTLTAMGEQMEAYPILKKVFIFLVFAFFTRVVQIELVTGIPKHTLPIVFIVLFTLLLFWGIGMPLLVAVVGFLYPVFASYKAISQARDPEPIKYWLKFWLVWMSFFVCESFGDALMSRIPLYFPLKLLFLVCAQPT